MKSENVAVVTSPDLLISDTPCILCIGVDDYLDAIIDNIRRANESIVIYIANKDSEFDWLVNAYQQSNICILNCKEDAFFCGFFIDKTNVFYYNNTISYKKYNLNEIQNPEELMIANQNLDQVLEHIKSMKKEFRSLIKMRYFEDMSFKEMEAVLNQSQNTIRVKLFRAKKVLANLLKEDENQII